ncbi:unnamed protein product [Prorocentrum cordatum]|uniref:Alkaline phosphatase n=1 Tax=Prorocentrum cordatum TaxID=2364126 RepID=A0ABN9PNX2_9DINO|nr:unnamed protein product [Polarella glacialis]
MEAPATGAGPCQRAGAPGAGSLATREECAQACLDDDACLTAAFGAGPPGSCSLHAERCRPRGGPAEVLLGKQCQTAVPAACAAVTGDLRRLPAAASATTAAWLQLSGRGLAVLHMQCLHDAEVAVSVEARAQAPAGAQLALHVAAARAHGAWRQLAGVEAQWAPGAAGTGADGNWTWSAPAPALALDAGRFRLLLNISSGGALVELRGVRARSSGSCFLDPVPALHLDGLLIGHVGTMSRDSLVTDSAAAATALATGHRTDNLRIGELGGNSSRAVGTIMEGAEAAGLLTGLVTTTRLTHATPASFSAHTPSRSDEDLIARQQLQQGCEVLLGGGLEKFQASGRQDGRDLLQEAESLGYRIALNLSSLRAGAEAEAEAARSGRPPRLLGLFAESHLPYELDYDSVGPAVPSLRDMTAAALRVLSAGGPAAASGGRGLFLLVEGGRIDHAGHANDAPAVAREVLAFDDAVGEALGYVSGREGALLAVTADHETGGLSLGCCNAYDMNLTGLNLAGSSAAAMANEIYTALAGGQAVGISAAEAVRTTVAAAAGGAELPEEVVQELADIADELINASKVASTCQVGHTEQCADLMMRLDGGGTLQFALAQGLSRHAYGVGFTSHGHTAVDVPLYAAGAAQSLEPGFWQNDALGRALITALGVDPAEGLRMARERMEAAGVPPQ